MTPDNPLRNIKLTVEYDGTKFHGWQNQKGAQRTVQEEIEKVLKKLFKRNMILTGSGRTDQGVHALGQVANFKVSSDKTIDTIQKALNANLPEDIAIVKAEEVNLNFHAQYSVKSKIYRYTILNRASRGVIYRGHFLHFPRKINLPLIRREARGLIGRHNFKSFEASDPKRDTLKGKRDTIRTIKRITIKKKGDFLSIDIQADGFLYKMVRNIIGTLLAIGSGKFNKGSIKNILSHKNRNCAGDTAQAHGLTLLEVKY